MCRFLFHLFQHKWLWNLRCQFLLMGMITLACSNDRLRSQQFPPHCGAGFRMKYSPITWVHYVGSRGECLIRCVSQKKCLAANVITNKKTKMVCEMFDYVIWRCEADPNAESYRVKVGKLKLRTMFCV